MAPVPELPEVEVVRAGLAPAVTGARVAAVEVLDPRALKRHVPAAGDDGRGGHGITLSDAAGRERAADFERRVTGLFLGVPERRGKFMWIPVSTERERVLPGGDAPPPSEALLAHLGMSGQLLLRAVEAEQDRHVRIRLWIEHPEHGELRIDFADQRLFGSLALDALVPDTAGERGGETARDREGNGDVADRVHLIPSQAVHIARDPLDPQFDDRAFVAALRQRPSAVKKLLLDQTLLSGVGNIYADEALFRARLHPERPGTSLSERKARELLEALRAVFAQALAEGGTSFDEQYVNVNGQAGYFAHSLHAYGREGEACERCASPIQRTVIGGRSSHFCPRCQRKR